ncbi:MAG: N-acetylmuramic acid 6-phosphate etherase, partial [Pirellulales bacterium]
LTRAVEGAEDRAELAVEDLTRIQVGPRDVVVGIATSGRTPYVLGGIAHARQLGALTIGLACNADSPLATVAEQMIEPVVGPEVISGSTRLKAGTATKLVLNMLTTGAMVQLGKTYGDLMVDLRATNSKLLARTRRIVRQLTGLADPAVEQLLARCDGELKTAVVVQQCQIEPAQARQLLAQHGGQLRRALDAAAPDQLFLGVDGGGTKTVAWLAVRGPQGEPQLVGRGKAGPSNPRAVGLPTATTNLQAAMQAAFHDAGREPTPVQVACLAIAGAGRPEEQAALREWALAQQVAREVLVTHDAEPVLAAGTPDLWGIALIAGTGSLAWGRSPDGRTARCGGWGYLLGDEGSGYAVGAAALQAVLRAADGRGPSTLLTAPLLNHFQVERVEALVGAVYGAADFRSRIAAASRCVVAVARQGDEVARKIVAQATAELAETVAALARQLDFRPGSYPLAVAGGLLDVDPTLVTAVEAQLAQRGMAPQSLQQVPDPVAGAVRLAAQWHSQTQKIARP